MWSPEPLMWNGLSTIQGNCDPSPPGMNRPLDEMTPEELGVLFPVILADPDPGWTRLYQLEKEEIARSLGAGRALTIEHIGSTAVPGIKAKPTIDILIEVPESTEDDRLIGRLRQMGYHYIPRLDNPPPHMMFVKGYTRAGYKGQAYHLHVRYPGEWDEIRFRDYLVSHPVVAREYEDLKIRLSAAFRNDREGYTEAKTEFIRAVIEKSRKN
jgi:GrpB-like predicted nucleotidyltransferase (UPF0157 family)